jgi:AraC-like DNA-binding protein
MNDTFVPPPFSAMQAGAWPATYHRHAPTLALLRKPDAGVHRHASLPIDLYVVTVYCDPAIRCAPGDESLDLEVAVSALRTKPASFVSSGGGEMAVALLTPLGLPQVFRTPMEKLVDRRLPLAYFVGWTDQCRLRDALLVGGDAGARLHALGAWLELRVADPRPLGAPMARVAELADALQRHDAPTNLERLVERLGVGRRQVERDFVRWLGVSPGQFLRIVRFQRAAAAILAGDTLTGAAASHGYADQAHMTRAFGVLARRVVMGLAQPVRAGTRAVCAARDCATV